MQKSRQYNGWKTKNYCGYKNYYTWNVCLFIDNDFNLYSLVREWKNNVNNKIAGYKKTYSNLLEKCNLTYCKTPDGVSFNDVRICRKEVINCIFED